MSSEPFKFLDPTNQEFFDMYCENERCDVKNLQSVLSTFRNLCSDYHYAVRRCNHLQKTVDFAGLTVPNLPTVFPSAAVASTAATNESPKKQASTVIIEKKPSRFISVTNDFLDDSSGSNGSENLLKTPTKKRKAKSPLPNHRKQLRGWAQRRTLTIPGPSGWITPNKK